LRNFLSEMLGEPGDALLPEAPTGHRRSLRPGLRIYGMVSVESLRGYQ
jgi:hypothetical protein